MKSIFYLSILLLLLISCKSDENSTKIKSSADINQQDERDKGVNDVIDDNLNIDELRLQSSYSSDNGVVFVRNQTLFLVYFDGSEAELIANNAEIAGISPDKKTILYLTLDSPKTLMTFDTQTRTGRELIAFEGELLGNITDWSPDGKWFLFSSPHAQSLSNSTELPPLPSGQIAFSSGQETQWVISLDGVQHELPSTAGAVSDGTFWLEDSTLIVYTFTSPTELNVWHFDPITGQVSELEIDEDAWGRIGLRLNSDNPKIYNDVQSLLTPFGYFLAAPKNRDIGNVVYDESLAFSLETIYTGRGSWPCISIEIVQKPLQESFLPTTIFENSNTALLSNLLLLPDDSAIFIRVFAPNCNPEQMDLEVLRVEIDGTITQLFRDSSLATIVSQPQFDVSSDRHHMIWINNSSEALSKLMLTDLENNTTSEIMAVSTTHSDGSDMLTSVLKCTPMSRQQNGEIISG